MKRLTFILILIVLCHNLFSQNEAEQLFIKATSHLLTSNLQMNINQKTTDKKGRVKEKSFSVMLAKFGEEEKTKMILTAPERAKGVTIVMSKVDNEEGIIEVYTPANGKTRKMIANEKNMATVGSDFSFSNYNSTNWKELEIQLIGNEEVTGKSCQILEVRSKEKTDGGKAELFIDTQNHRIFQIKTYNSKGNQKSETILADYKLVPGSDGKFQPCSVKTKSTDKNQVSEIQVVELSTLINPTKEDFLIERSEEEKELQQ